MMTKKEIRELSTEKLIFTLCSHIMGYRVTKSSLQDAKRIAEELQNRGIIEDANSLYQEWETLYTA